MQAKCDQMAKMNHSSYKSFNTGISGSLKKAHHPNLTTAKLDPESSPYVIIMQTKPHASTMNHISHQRTKRGCGCTTLALHKNYMRCNDAQLVLWDAHPEPIS
mmetsp:Transcript_93873/g.166072  ORF Transcript_93873/g.166072 Transcript_93873/m.166072 type:complete len:103 (-) Transcript_93873:1-309(-)